MRRRQMFSQQPSQFGVARTEAVHKAPPPVAAPVSLPEPKGYDSLSDAALVACYQAKFGQKPRGRAKRETIIARLTDDAGNERA
jgi:hypothetical protein